MINLKELDRFKTFILIVIGTFLFGAAVYQLVQHVDKEQVKIWDEAYTAHNAIEMLEDGNWLIVHYDGEPDHFNTRPPMAVWTKVISYKLFGISEFSVRLPSLVAAILTFIILLLFGTRFLKDPLTTFFTLTVIATTAGYMHYHVARTGDPESLLIFFVTCFIVLYFILLERYPDQKVKYLVLIGTAVVLAVWTKSIAGLTPLAGIAVYTLTRRKGYLLLKDWRFHLTWFLTLAVTLSYYLIREAYDPGYLEAVIRMEFNIISDPYVVKHPEFSFYYDYLRGQGLRPYMYFWFIPLVPMVFSKNPLMKRLLLYSFLGSSIYLAGMSSATLKNEWYISPIYPFLWIWFGAGIAETLRMISDFIKKEKTRQIVLVLLALAFVVYIYPFYMKILRENHQVATGGYIYPPERTGNFLDQLKEGPDELDSLKIIEYEAHRQVKFYMKKYEHEENTHFTLYSKYPSSGLENSHVIVCGDSLRERISSEYDHRVVEEAKYCTLYQTFGKKMEQRTISN